MDLKPTIHWKVNHFLQGPIIGLNAESLNGLHLLDLMG